MNHTQHRAIVYCKKPTALVNGVSFGPYLCYVMAAADEVDPFAPVLPVPDETGQALVGRSYAFVDVYALAVFLLQHDLMPEPLPSEEGWPNDWMFVDEASMAYLLAD
ncbi:hypothetical protein [Rhizobacter sp. Root404]|uniref:hypothetical protein n=1 Tax=Rhizobacter sp. Root404 TaxID=1736528 RepID=UPI0006FBC759|nr:hypothetical protein [Rhizobacter sp. Root404]KQW36770.1 hypothetical protein ASC76_19225 [Rhizobacter sp. Root404]